MKKSMLSVLLALFCVGHSVAQKTPIKFGKVTEEELALKECSFYPQADAMVLGKSGRLHFIYHQEKGWQYELEVTVRKKIFTAKGKEEADIKISYYSPIKGSNREEISGLKAVTYNLVDGKIEKVKLPNSEEHETQLNDFYRSISFAMPAVTEGSVIEYTYTSKSDFISNLATWHFQSDLPVAYSEFRYTIPQFFNYQISQLGSYIEIESEEKKVPETFMLIWHEEQAGIGNFDRNKGTRRTSELKSESNRRYMVAKNVLPFKDEPFMTNKVDVPARLEFQLMSIQYPNEGPKTIAGSYERFNNELLESERFGFRLDKGNFAKEFIETLSGTETEKAAQIFYWLQKHFSWNETHTMFSDLAGKQAFNKKEGTVADINLSLISAYHEAGITAFPVILSTRGHGMVHPVFPNFSEYNYVVALVVIDGNMFFADASADMPFGMLPTKCLNGNGWLVKPGQGQWVNLKQGAVVEETIFSQVEIKEDEVVKKVSVKKDGYTGIALNKSFVEKGEDEFKTSIKESFNDWELAEFSFEAIKNRKEGQFAATFSKELDDPDLIYLQPVGYGFFDENPFQQEKRFSQVDFAHGYAIKGITQITLPEGYKAELPESTMLKLPKSGGTYLYNISQVGNTISLMVQFKLEQKTFTPEEYTFLKEFFDRMVKKNKEVIVLKKQS